jgi:glycine hydroxymethyltransferase
MIFSRLEMPEGVDRSRFPSVKATLAQAVDKTVFPGVQGGPQMHAIAAKAVAFRLDATEEFRDDQRRTIENANVLAEEIQRGGARVVSGGTDNHLALVDVSPLGVTGRDAERILDEIGITVNKNAIPFDPLPPNTSSGIRVGTPAVTTRGFGVEEMRAVGRMIGEAIRTRDEPAEQARLAGQVREICERFPVPGIARV